MPTNNPITTSDTTLVAKYGYTRKTTLKHLNQPVKQHYASRAPLVGAAGSLPAGMILDGSHDAEAVEVDARFMD